jgi:hypothetical protein
MGADKRHEVLATTLLRPPVELGATQWSSRLLASKVGLALHSSRSHLA